MKKNIIVYMFSFLGIGITYGQAEISGGLASVAISDGFEAVQGYAGQLSFDYDFLKDSKLRASVGTDFLIGNAFAVSPGIKLGFDFINLKMNFDSDGVIWYGLGSRIGIGSVHGITISLQGGTMDGFGLGWFNIGYSYRF